MQLPAMFRLSPSPGQLVWERAPSPVQPSAGLWSQQSGFAIDVGIQKFLHGAHAIMKKIS
jgi:hypothetical protein